MHRWLIRRRALYPVSLNVQKLLQNWGTLNIFLSKADISVVIKINIYIYVQLHLLNDLYFIPTILSTIVNTVA